MIGKQSLHFLDIGHLDIRTCVLVVFLVDSLPTCRGLKKERNEEFLPGIVRLGWDFGARLLGFAYMSGAFFRHGGGGDEGREFMGMVVEAICVIVQYQMDNGRGLFAVSYIV
jgi:hypothetical protein